MNIKGLLIVLVLMLIPFKLHPKESVGSIEVDPIQVIYQKTLHVDARETKQESLARAINKLYKHTSYHEALDIVQTVYEMASKHSFKPILFLGLIAAESSFKRKAKSNHGAIGYTQVVPKWHKDKIRNRDLFNTQVNLEVGALVLKGCLDKHNQVVKKALHCYNGALTLAKQQQYVRKVTTRQQELTAHAL